MLKDKSLLQNLNYVGDEQLFSEFTPEEGAAISGGRTDVFEKWCKALGGSMDGSWCCWKAPKIDIEKTVCVKDCMWKGFWG